MTAHEMKKAAFIMGGTQGIGWATALMLADQGADVAVFGVEEGAENAGDRHTSSAGQIIGFRGDGGSEADVRDAIDATVARFGRLDTLVCCAAMHPYGTVTETTPDIWNRTMAVNVGSAYLTSHFGIPHLLAAGGGAVVNVASNQGVACNPDVAAYATTKGAILSLTRSIANDFAHRNIRANSVSPGPVDTPMLRAAAAMDEAGRPLDEVYDEWKLRVPNHRIAAPEEIARVIVFLAGDGGSYCSGSNFVCDGGLLSRLGF